MEKEELKQEALERMKALKLDGQVIRDFEKNNKVYYSEDQGGPFKGILYWLDNEPEYIKIKERLESEGKLVYHAVLAHTQFGDCLSFLFVGKEKEEWPEDREDIREGYAFTWTENLDDNWSSEYGTIAIRPANGGLVRVG